MYQPERWEVLILGSGEAGKLLAWHMARSGRRTAVVERRWIGGSCPNIPCLPSKNEIWSARVAHLAQHAAQFGTMTGPVAIDMAKVRQRKRDMVDREIGRGARRHRPQPDSERPDGVDRYHCRREGARRVGGIHPSQHAAHEPDA